MALAIFAMARRRVLSSRRLLRRSLDAVESTSYSASIDSVAQQRILWGTRFSLEHSMQGRRGRPVRGGMRHWVNDEAYRLEVTSLMRSRDRSNEETLTEVTHSLEAFATETLPEGTLTDRRSEIVRRLALGARPALVWRTLLGWRLGLEDRIIRHILKREDLKAIAEIRWA